MRVEKDFEELLRLFNKHKVRYCIVGAFAFAFHAVPRYTKDIDLLVEPETENAKRVIAALEEFGFKSLDLAEADFEKENSIVQLGFEPVRIDIITSVSGDSFDAIWKEKKIGLYGEEKVPFAGLDSVIRMKKAAGRLQDLADLEVLKKISKKKRARRS